MSNSNDLTALADRLEGIAKRPNPACHPVVQQSIREVAAALRSQAAGGWVRTSERLPEEGQDVWVVCGEGPMPATFTDVSFFIYNDDYPMDDPPEWWMPIVYPSTPPHTD